MGFWALTGQSSFPNGPFHVTFRGLHEIISWWLRVGAWRSLVAHYNGVVGVEGSNPFAPTNKQKNRLRAVFLFVSRCDGSQSTHLPINSDTEIKRGEVADSSSQYH
jgi:hypothetical protein